MASDPGRHRNAVRLVVHALRWTVACLAAALAGVVSVVAAAAATGFITIGWAAGVAFAFVVAAACLFRRGKQRRALAGASLIVVALSAVTTATVARPMGGGPLPSRDADGTWHLPTGSSLDYRAYRAEGRVDATPVILLHGGPGVSMSRSGERLLAEPLNRSGFDVYGYDQLGAGWSTRLTDLDGYTVDRQVADLEAIRLEIGAENLYLIGGSWGAELAAAYMGSHPGRVRGAVLFSPGQLNPHNENIGGSADSRSDSGSDRAIAGLDRSFEERLGNSPKFYAAMLMYQFSSRAAHAFLGDDKIDAAYSTALIAGIERGGIRRAPTRSGYWVAAAQIKATDVRDRLRQDQAPVLVLRGEREEIPEPVAQEYVKLLQNARYTRFEGVGHLMLAEDPERVAGEIVEFMRRVRDGKPAADKR